MDAYTRCFNFVNLIPLQPKPRNHGLIEIRGPYYEAFSVGQLKDLLKTWGHYIDGFKFAGGSQALLNREIVQSFINIAHEHQVYVNTGGFIERVVLEQPKNVNKYLEETLSLGFDVVEISSGMFENMNDFPIKDQVCITKEVTKMGLKAKPEITIMSGVGGGVKEFNYKNKVKAVKNLNDLFNEADQFFDAGAYMLMIESEGITEGIADPKEWRSDIIFGLLDKYGPEKLMFEISPEDDEARKTFKWYLKEVSPKVNLMMNAKNIVEFNAWRLHLWGDKDIWKKEEKIHAEN